jgi:hypothetical protein
MTNLNTNWFDNNMTGNGRGMVLNGAVIGDQKPLGTHPMYNHWLGSWAGVIIKHL